MVSYPATVCIDLNVISNNIKTLADYAERAQSSAAQIMAVVKADGYGHGATESAKAALAGGATWLGVAQLAEALDLRRSGINAQMLSWLYQPSDDLTEAIEQGIDLSVASPQQLTQVVDAAEKVGTSGRIHLKIDTGLSRNGSPERTWGDLLAAVASARASKSVDVIGIWSHFVLADNPSHPTVRAQRERFIDACNQAQRLGIRPQMRHLANSAATVMDPSSHFDMVRPGLAVYGLSPVPTIRTSTQLGITPAMSLTSKVALVKDLPPGQGISYGHVYRTAAHSTVALVPIGYADGVPRHAGSTPEKVGAPVSISDRLHTISGRVCMDQFMVDLSQPRRDVAAGDEVVLFGDGTNGGPTAEDWARAAGTISYEIVTRIGHRIPRVYRGIGGSYD